MEGKEGDFFQESIKQKESIEIEQKIKDFFDFIETTRTELEKKGLSKDIVIVDNFKERMDKFVQQLVNKKKALGEKADQSSKSFNDIYGSHMCVVTLTEKMRREDSEFRSSADVFQRVQKQEAAVPDPKLPVFSSILEGQQFVKNNEEWRKKFNESPVDFLNFDFSPEGRKIFFQNLGAFGEKEEFFRLPEETTMTVTNPLPRMKNATTEFYDFDSSKYCLKTKMEDIMVGFKFYASEGSFGSDGRIEEQPGSHFTTELQFSGAFLKKMIEQAMNKQAEQK